MSRLIIRVDNEISKIIGDVDITSGDISTVDIEFKFSADWDGYKKTVLLYTGLYEKEEATWLLLNNDVLLGSDIPMKLFEKPGFLSIGVFGDNDNDQRISANIVTKRIAPGSHSGDVDEEVEYSLYNQIIKELIELERTTEAFDVALAEGIDEINELSETKLGEIDATATDRINAVTDLATNKINDINTLATDKLNAITNSVNGHMTNINNSVNAHIGNIGNVVNGHIDNLARIVNGHITNIGNEANNAINHIKDEVNGHIASINALANSCITNINNVTNTNMGNINNLTRDSQYAISVAVEGHLTNINNAVQGHMSNISNAAQGHLNNLNNATNNNLNAINQRTEEKSEELDSLEDIILFDLGLIREKITEWQSSNNTSFVTIDLTGLDYVTVQTDTDVPCHSFTYFLNVDGDDVDIDSAHFKITKDEWGTNTYMTIYIMDSNESVRNRKIAATKVSTFTKID